MYRPGVYFRLVGEITDIKAIARGVSVRERARLSSHFGRARWRKLKGVALVELSDGELRQAEVHWYAAHGIGRRKFTIRRFLD